MKSRFDSLDAARGIIAWLPKGDADGAGSALRTPPTDHSFCCWVPEESFAEHLPAFPARPFGDAG